MFEKILVTLDGSPLAEAVLPYAKELAACLQADVLLLQVVSPAPTIWAVEAAPGMVVDPMVMAEQLEIAVEEAEKYMRGVADNWGTTAGHVSWAVRQGVPADEIISYAHEQGVGMIAMSTHGRTGILRLVLGSVADSVLRNAGIPVLLVRPPK